MSANPLSDLAMEVLAAYNRGDLEAWETYYAADYAHHNPYQPNVQGLKAYKQLQTSFQENFPGIQLVPEDIITQGTLASGSVVVMAHLQGTGKGTWRGASITGKQINFSCILSLKIVDGKLTEGWEHDDYLALFTQLGLIPAPASAAPATSAHPAA